MYTLESVFLKSISFLSSATKFTFEQVESQVETSLNAYVSIKRTSMTSKINISSLATKPRQSIAAIEKLENTLNLVGVASADNLSSVN